MFLGDDCMIEFYWFEVNDGFIKFYIIFDVVCLIMDGGVEVDIFVVVILRIENCFGVDLFFGYFCFLVIEDELLWVWGDFIVVKIGGFRIIYWLCLLLKVIGLVYDIVIIDVGLSLGFINCFVFVVIDSFLMLLGLDVFSFFGIWNIV